MDILSFCLLSIAIILIPGPSVLVIISTSLNHGKARGFQTVAGTSLAMSIQLLIAAIGTSWFVEKLSYGFVLLKWFGVIYLLFLGIQQLIAYFKHSGTGTISSSFSFKRGFFVSLTNPKTIIFFSAFLPQFVNPTLDYNQQILTLSITFLLLAAFFDSGYVLMTSWMRSLLTSTKTIHYQQGVSGVVYLSASALLASSKQ